MKGAMHQTQREVYNHPGIPPLNLDDPPILVGSWIAGGLEEGLRFDI